MSTYLNRSGIGTFTLCPRSKIARAAKRDHILRQTPYQPVTAVKVLGRSPMVVSVREYEQRPGSLARGRRAVADAHQKFTDDPAAGKAKRPAKELRPLLRRARMVRREPKGERPVRLPQRLNTARVLGRGLDFEAVADDARIGEQPFDLHRAEGGDAVDREIGAGGPKRCALFEDRRPGEAGLIDFKDQPLEQHVSTAVGKPYSVSW